MKILTNISSIWKDHSDTRSDGLFLMESPLPTFFICLTYVFLAQVLGPRLMKNREPFKLNKLLVCYNFFQVNLSVWLFYKASVSGWIFGGYSYKCQPVDYSRSLEAQKAFSFSYWYFLVKFLELLDTLFFILRKKTQQVSTLHVVHHGTMPFTAWWMMKFVPGGHATFVAFVNTFVHIFMYSYYLLAALGPKYLKLQKFLEWKKYLTLLQILQFILVILHAGQLFFRKCDFPMWVVYFHLFHSVVYLMLFGDFYMKTYSSGNMKMKIRDGNLKLEEKNQ